MLLGSLLYTRRRVLEGAGRVLVTSGRETFIESLTFISHLS